MHDPRKVRGRFAVEHDCDGWTVVDYAYGLSISSDTRAEAERMATFARAYVKKHGDINFDSFPYSMREELTAEDTEHLAEIRT
jgi:hypothetical protein